MDETKMSAPRMLMTNLWMQQSGVMGPKHHYPKRRFIMTAIRLFYARNSQVLAKTMTYYFMHISVAAAVAYAVTGSRVTAITLSLLEPTVQAFAFFAHEKVWQKTLFRRQQRTGDSSI